MGGKSPSRQLPDSDLETVGPYTYGGRLKHPFTAHPKVDPATGELLLFGYAWRKPYVQYSVVNALGQIVRTIPIDIPRPIMMHDFAVTARHTLFMDLPMPFSIERRQRGEPMLKFEPELGARFGILPRHGTGQDIQWFEASSCYVFHTLNAYEDGDEVVLLACRYQEFSGSFFMPLGMRPGGRDVIGKEEVTRPNARAEDDGWLSRASLRRSFVAARSFSIFRSVGCFRLCIVLFYVGVGAARKATPLPGYGFS
ncbi:MAG: carotenoid oxygenase family protein [Candidatus Entotheonellia bacterium]